MMGVGGGCEGCSSEPGFCCKKLSSQWVYSIDEDRTITETTENIINE